MLGQHVEALLVAQEKSREFKRKTRYFTEHWRDIVLFVTTLLFVVIIWHADHHRPVWLPLLIATIVMSVVTGIYVVRGFLRSVRPRPLTATTTTATATAIPNEWHADCCGRWAGGLDPHGGPSEQG